MNDEYLLSFIDEVAQKSSQKTAVIDKYGSYNFEYISTQSNNVAHNLNSRGIGVGDYVAIYMERSTKWIISMLGILKSGAAYVPLDPNYPKSRIDFCLDNSEAKAVIFDENVSTSNIRDAISIQSLQEFNGHFISRGRDVSAPAYMIYTSGSTGQPKGVVVPFTALTHHMKWFISSFNFLRDDIFLQKTSSSFDASIWEYLAPLMLGCKMVISESSPYDIVTNIKKYNVTVIQLVPTVLEFITKNFDISELVTLKKVFCGGESLSVRLANIIHDQLSIPVINLYGPTEATIQCSYFIYMPGDVLISKFLPIGKPIPKVKFELSDNEIGELIIEGPCVSDGYYKLESKSADKFSLNDSSGHRRYKSGDLVRRDKAGNYHFIERVDNQVKLRGLRIDLTEIEEVINTFSNVVTSSIVLINGNEQLVAHINLNNDDLDFSKLKKYLIKHLPGYMIPVSFVKEIEFPSLPNGKLDRNKFIQNLKGNLSQNKIHPSSHPINLDKNSDTCPAKESEVASFIHDQWESILFVKPNENSHFFLSGGHSLSAINLVMNINKKFGIKLPTVCLLISPRINDFIQKVELQILASKIN
ncbi:non-ribosomal peptide synthetase [Yersinia enterocolitica]|uniref:non-ribosomal peptide synthetase n=1 Tax=Yersinia enterocolitica TaxID=630 RepID=UPI001C8DE1B2|nr:non-ribosomal peptide synthetase [Yersinia enterocolitica]MBX9497565.1 non-ribosomal peptide synthetase [Yersinia enterocolitica]